jgi:hypothetical protein
MIGSSLLGGVTIAKQTWPSEVLDQATTILTYLLPAFKRNPAGVRISYAARCDDAKAAPLIPPIRLQKASRSNTLLEATRSVVSGDSNTIVSGDQLGNVRIEIGNVPGALLRTKIAAFKLSEVEQYNPTDAVAAIQGTNEVERAAAALGLRPMPFMSVQLLQRATPGAPHMPSLLQNLTVDQILAMVTARFKGAVLYGICAQGPRPRRFLLEFLDSDQWSD